MPFKQIKPFNAFYQLWIKDLMKYFQLSMIFSCRGFDKATYAVGIAATMFQQPDFCY